MQPSATVAVFRAFLQARWLQARLKSRAALEAHQQRGLYAWRAHLAASFPHLAGESLVMDKANLMADFATYNQGQITADEVRAALETGEVLPGVACGTSTGTSGNRGLYVITDQERYRWLGTILAKGLPDVWRRRHRVAVILPQNSALYQAGNQSRWLKLAFYDLRDGPDAWGAALEAFDPTVVIAPPKVLRWLAVNADLDRLRPRRLYAGAETLDPPDRRIIEEKFGLRLGQIYMATEGLFGVSCPHGMLHLTEDFVRFDLEPVGEGLVSPRVTDFSRRYQVMSRYQMNDLLQLSDKPCACGSPLQAVEAVVGRQDDVFWFDDVMVTPDVLRNAVLNADHSIEDFRLRQGADGRVELALPLGLSETAKAAAVQGVETLLKRRGVEASVGLVELDQADLYARKLRRVERLRS